MTQFKQNFSKKRILVTGSEGNVGSELVPYLESLGHDVLCLDVLQKYRPNYILCDILNLADAETEISAFKPDIVFHLAAMVSRITCEKSLSMAISTNMTGTSNIIQLCKRHNAKLINFSTSEVYGNQNILLEEDITPMPNNIYGITKLWAEELVAYEGKHSNLKYINVRPFMMYSEYENMGENRSAMIRFAESVVTGNTFEVHKNAQRSWLHMSDAVEMYERLMHINSNELVNVGNSTFIDIEEMARFMCDYVGQDHSLIQLSELPDKMTLTKIASFDKLKQLINYTPKVDQKHGMIRVIERVQRNLKK
jgi:nucleoside-diphosphate-sugar epimerase